MTVNLNEENVARAALTVLVGSLVWKASDKVLPKVFTGVSRKVEDWVGCTLRVDQNNVDDNIVQE